MKTQLLISATLFLMINTAPAVGQSVGSVLWQSNGGGCVPTDATVRDQHYLTATGGGRVKYKGSGTEQLVFSCPVTSFNPNVIELEAIDLRLYYQDPDGPGEAFKVEARLLSFAKSNGALEEACKVTSNEEGQWKFRDRTCGAINLGAKFYWVEVKVQRTSPSKLVVEFNGVSLEHVIN